MMLCEYRTKERHVGKLVCVALLRITHFLLQQNCVWFLEGASISGPDPKHT